MVNIMKLILPVLLVGTCSFVFASIDDIQIPRGGYHPYKLADADYLEQYKRVLSLFKHVNQPSFDKDHFHIAKDYSVQAHMDNYSDTHAVKEFLYYYRRGMLPKNEIFSIFYDDHLKQAVALFKILYCAKDFEAFYTTAVWARHNLNQGLFLYSFSVAIIHRYDTYSMVLPPIYEIYPYYFFNAEVIQKAQEYKQLYTLLSEEHTIYTNYSGRNLNLHPEQSLSYFTEDIGVNAYYYYYNLCKPFWMSTKDCEINTYHRGEEFYYFYQQFLARYYLERLSNNLGEVAMYNYEEAFEVGYCPSLSYPSGLAFPARSNLVRFFTNYHDHEQIRDYERRIRDAIDFRHVFNEVGEKLALVDPGGFNTLGNIIESNPESLNRHFYGDLQAYARHLLGNSYPYTPSALEHFETSLRDPAFWQMYKRLILHFQKYKNYLPSYSYEQLLYPGVRIEGIQVDRLVTYFENYDVDLRNAVFVNGNEWEHDPFVVYARQYRLNHKPFTYKIKVHSEQAAEAVVRVFIGPKHDEYDRFININKNRVNFVEFDRFKRDLKVGENIIQRNSYQIFYSTDRTSYKQLYKYVMAGIGGTEQFVTHGSEVYYAFPNRLLLPKGKHGGQPYQFYVMISPYKAPHSSTPNQQEQKPQENVYDKLHEGVEYDYFKYPMVGLGVQYLDDHALGYPFDRPIDEYNFYVPNGYFQDVIIYHEHKDDNGDSSNGAN